MTEQNRGRVFAGAFLILLGLIFFAMQFASGWGDSLFLIVIGALFVAGYFYRHAYGLLIPGCLLLGLGVGQALERTIVPYGEMSVIGLGAGFVAIYLIDLAYRRASHWWSLIPGVVLILVGLAQSNPLAQYWLSVGWPVTLIAIGLLTLAGALGFRKGWS